MILEQIWDGPRESLATSIRCNFQLLGASDQKGWGYFFLRDNLTL
jgi:hypothetical protein